MNHERTCIGCRTVKPAHEMTRICLNDNRLVIDSGQRLGGRGAYICSAHCLETACKRKAVQRALRCNVSPEDLHSLSMVYQDKE